MIVACTLHDAFRANLSSEMELRGISQSELARRIGVSPSYISQLISGHRGAGLDTVDKIASALSVPADQLIRLRDKAPARAS